jgi:hypothetical protein
MLHTSQSSADLFLETGANVSIPQVVRKSAVVVALLAIASVASAQVQVTFYDAFPTTPNPLGAFGAGTAFCSATVGTAEGFSLDFTDAATRLALCGANAGLLDPSTSMFGARFTGTLSVPSTGVYSLFLDADDGDALAIGSDVLQVDWNDKAFGPGPLVESLVGGDQSFVLDYYQGPCCGAFARVDLSGDALTFVTPPVTAAPEPSSLALMATGAFGLVGVLKRRRAK